MYHFLTVEDVVADQEMLLATYGGGFTGILNQGQLESAVYQPQAGFCTAYFRSDAYEMASAYLEHLLLAHAFCNGNKRIALSSALRFLCVNGVRIRATSAELVDLVLGVIAHRVTDEQITQFFRDHAQEILDFQLAQDDASRATALQQASEWVNSTCASAMRKLAE